MRKVYDDVFTNERINPMSADTLRQSFGNPEQLIDQARNPDAGAFTSPARYAAHLEGLCQELADEVERLQGENTKYKSRLQVLRGAWRETDFAIWIAYDYPEAREWFDEDGVPT